MALSFIYKGEPRMNKQEILNYLAEKKRITAPVAAGGRTGT